MTLRTNAKTIIQENGNKFTNFEFTYQLGKSLVLPSIERRYQYDTGLRIETMKKIRDVLGVNTQLHRQRDFENEPVRGRCTKCVDSIVGTPNYKKLREKLNKDIRVKCVICGCFICKNHTDTICSSCYQG